MNHPGDRQTESSDRDCDGHVYSCDARRIEQSEMLVPDMCRVRDATDQPRRKSPGGNVGGGKDSDSADEQVHDADKKRRTNPTFGMRCDHGDNGIRLAAQRVDGPPFFVVMRITPFMPRIP